MDFHPLDDDLRRRFDTDGFLVVRQAIPRAAVDELIAAGDRLMASDRVDNRARLSPTHDGFRNAVGLDPAIARLACEPRTVSWMLQLLSPDIQIHTSQLIYKRPDPAADPRTLTDGWHRDIHPLPEDLGDDGNRRFEIKVAYYLSRAHGMSSGVTLVARGSHRWRARPPFDEEGNPPETVACELEPGDALLFENRTWHAARVNSSAITRKVVIIGYSYRWMRPDDWNVQDPETLEPLDDYGRELLTPTTRRDANGAFTIMPSNPRTREMAEKHGVLGSAAWARAHAVATP